MQKTIFRIKQMDCSSEESLIRMAIGDMEKIKSLSFNIGQRQLTVIHDEGFEDILMKLNLLNLDTSVFSTEKSYSNLQLTDEKSQKRLLITVLIINFLFFLIEIVAGFLSNSMGLVADSFDMLADSIIYGLALLAVGRSLYFKKNVAKTSGYFQLLIAVLGILEVIRRCFYLESVPDIKTMITISSLAFIGNALCLYVLQKSKSSEAHMQASMIFTSNDIIVNIGVIIAAVAVYLTKSPLPDLVVGIIVFMIVAKGALRILRL